MKAVGCSLPGDIPASHPGPGGSTVPVLQMRKPRLRETYYRPSTARQEGGGGGGENWGSNSQALSLLQIKKKNTSAKCIPCRTPCSPAPKPTHDPGLTGHLCGAQRGVAGQRKSPTGEEPAPRVLFCSLSSSLSSLLSSLSAEPAEPGCPELTVIAASRQRLV